MSPRQNMPPFTPRIVIVPASPPTTTSPTYTTDSDDLEDSDQFSPMSISPTSPTATSITAPPRRYRRLLPASTVQTQSQQHPHQATQAPTTQATTKEPIPSSTQLLSPAFPPPSFQTFFTFHPANPTPVPLPSTSFCTATSTESRPNKRPNPNSNPTATAKPTKKKNNRTTPTLEAITTHLRTKLYPLVSSTTGHEHPAFPRTLLAFHCLTHAQLDALARHFHQVYPPVAATGFYPITVPPWVGTDRSSGRGNVDLETKRRRFGRFIGLRGCESPISISSFSSFSFPWGKKGGEGAGVAVSDDDGDELVGDWGEMAERKRRVRGWLEKLDSGVGGAGDSEGLERPKDAGSGGGRDREQQGTTTTSTSNIPLEEETEEQMLARMEREWFDAMLRARLESDFAMRWKMGGGF
ncbi:uncharacterized protein BO97DRAFT_458412 [Aspergillus homomorphus CBS 101889]|uniref:Uncharacterized protein n=1 Tax=Aspergillus homomorphus (strain CBS 101889) TaxID=1450537 RepID=A0A395HQX8_ASPHC|nr:hypothetical protein BO97DRAFT_458412 [Aspergillus homomorphus CBS 101889]RAL09258.1 hypothetical protein BO97DRAFT_458412 [Aspergillus homomorphus CBS 101889]